MCKNVSYQFLHSLHTFSTVEVHFIWLVGKYLDGFRSSSVRRSTDLQGVNFNGLVERYRQHKLFVAIRLQELKNKPENVKDVHRCTQGFALTRC